jgi:peptidoglycan/xylan/chitin deacetylase (PgdA/CDA1 family)
MGASPVSALRVELLCLLEEEVIRQAQLGLKSALFWLSALAGAIQFLLAGRKPREGLTILCYHRIADGLPHAAPFNPYNVRPHVFGGQVDACLKIGNTKVVSASEVRKWVYAGQMPAGAYVMFTFDDGRQNVMAAASKLQESGLPGVVFVATGFLDEPVFSADPYDRWASGLPNPNPSWCRPLTRDECRALVQMGMEVQPHTHTHRNMGKLRGVELQDEIGRSKAIVQEIGQDPHIGFAYPGGSTRTAVSAEAEAALRESGTAFCVSTDAGHNPPALLERRRFQLKRLPVHDCDKGILFQAKAAGYGGLLPILKDLSYLVSPLRG